MNENKVCTYWARIYMAGAVEQAEYMCPDETYWRTKE